MRDRRQPMRKTEKNSANKGNKITAKKKKK